MKQRWRWLRVEAKSSFLRPRSRDRWCRTRRILRWLLRHHRVLLGALEAVEELDRVLLQQRLPQRRGVHASLMRWSSHESGWGVHDWIRLLSRHLPQSRRLLLLRRLWKEERW